MLLVALPLKCSYKKWMAAVREQVSLRMKELNIQTFTIHTSVVHNPKGPAKKHLQYDIMGDSAWDLWQGKLGIVDDDGNHGHILIGSCACHCHCLARSDFSVDRLLIVCCTQPSVLLPCTLRTFRRPNLQLLQLKVQLILQTNSLPMLGWREQCWSWAPNPTLQSALSQSRRPGRNSQKVFATSLNTRLRAVQSTPAGRPPVLACTCCSWPACLIRWLCALWFERAQSAMQQASLRLSTSVLFSVGIATRSSS
jgi:hypothetical protein